VPRVAFIGGTPAQLRRAGELGVEVIVAHEAGRYDPQFHEYAAQVLHVPLADRDAVYAALASLHRQRRFDLVISCSDDYAELAGWLAETFDAAGTREATAKALKDKATMRRVLQEHGVALVRHLAPASAEEAIRFLEETGPIVLKPSDAVASQQIHRVETAEQAIDAWNSITGAGFAVFAEEFLDGPVMSLDSFSSGGRLLPLGISRYRMNEHYVEWEHRMPGPVEDAERTAAIALTAAVLDAVGLTDGPSHTEFVLTADGPRLLESHTRPGGLGIPDLLGRVYGRDPNDMYLAVLLGLEPLPIEVAEPVAGGAIRFFTPAPGVLEKIEGFEDLDATVLRATTDQAQGSPTPLLARLRDAPVGVVLPPDGYVVRALLSGKQLRNGYVLATGSDVDDAVAICDGVVDRLTFHMA
jgi:biotin carboxylase